ncbi:Uncharacterised protein [Mycobacteroides abscessus subsp. abscessus]|nr:Uncharacterised protein [Mycobacteroides abscessus subsp. abscessus]
MYSGETLATRFSIDCRTPKLPGVLVILVTLAPAALRMIATMLPSTSCSVKSFAATVIFTSRRES